MSRAVTSAPLPARQAFDLQAQIVADISDLKRRWVRLAGNLHAFHGVRGWEALGVETFNEWLADPTVDLKRAQAYLLIQAWQVFVADCDVQPDRLGEVDLTKVQLVMPALKRGDITADEALAECEALSKSDLREKYRGEPHQHEGEQMEECPDCGRLRRAA